MKVIDLLNKMANYEKMPKCIKVSGEIYKYYPAYKDYLKEDSSKWFISDFVDCYSDFNKEIEIIEDTPKDTAKEDKKIEKISLDDYVEFTTSGDMQRIDYMFNKNTSTFVDKINEIIDKINGE